MGGPTPGWWAGLGRQHHPGTKNNTVELVRKSFKELLNAKAKSEQQRHLWWNASIAVSDWLNRGQCDAINQSEAATAIISFYAFFAFILVFRNS